MSSNQANEAKTDRHKRSELRRECFTGLTMKSQPLTADDNIDTLKQKWRQFIELELQSCPDSLRVMLRRMLDCARTQDAPRGTWEGRVLDNQEELDFLKAQLADIDKTIQTRRSKQKAAEVIGAFAYQEVPGRDGARDNQVG